MDFLTAYISNIVSTILCHPIDVVKTNIQTSEMTIAQTVKTIIANKLYFRGLVPNLSTYPIFWGVFFQTKKIINTYDVQQTSFNKFLIYYCAGNVASLCANPLFVVKVHLQTTPNDTYAQIMKTIGVRGCYSGFSATIFNNAKLGIQFPIYDYLNADLNYGIGISALLSKGISTSVMYPLDLVRTQQRKTLNKESVFTILKRIYETVGTRGLYRGVLLYNCVSMPHFIIMMYGIELVK